MHVFDCSTDLLDEDVAVDFASFVLLLQRFGVAQFVAWPIRWWKT
jgi:hypothetical protein